MSAPPGGDPEVPKGMEVAAGRPPSGANLVRGVDGSAHAKRRLEWILKTLGGKATIREACAALGIGEAAFHKLRTRFLCEAVGLLEPRAVGRPPEAPEVAGEDRVRALEAEVAELRLEHRAAEVRTELALALPELGKRREKHLYAFLEVPRCDPCRTIGG